MIAPTDISHQLLSVKQSMPSDVSLVAVSKYQPAESIMEAYEAGQRLFGENHALELQEKYQALPKDIEWHFIGHLQTNKIKYIIPYVALIHSVDSLHLLTEINRRAQGVARKSVPCLLQVHIAQEEQKYGFGIDECKAALRQLASQPLPHICLRGLMGMATNTDNQTQVRQEFQTLHNLFLEMQATIMNPDTFNILSMGMSDDYPLAVESGANMIRVGSKIFGPRNYS